jgi:hypothetical protein
MFDLEKFALWNFVTRGPSLTSLSKQSFHPLIRLRATSTRLRLWHGLSFRIIKLARGATPFRSVVERSYQIVLTLVEDEN